MADEKMQSAGEKRQRRGGHAPNSGETRRTAGTESKDSELRVQSDPDPLGYYGGTTRAPRVGDTLA